MHTPFTDVVVDLETADTNTATGAVLSIGAVAFNAAQGMVSADAPTFHEALDLDDQLRHGRTISASTFSWWLGQSESARLTLAAMQDEAHRPVDALQAFIDWLREHTDLSRVRVWGNGANFDNPMLTNLMAVYGFKLPWNFYNDRCYRTAVAPFKRAAPAELAEGLVAHNALHDAIKQARVLAWGADNKLVTIA